METSRDRRMSRGDRRASGPSRRSSPALGRNRPARTLNSVLFPLPEGPITLVQLPRRTTSPTPRSATVSASRSR